MPQGTTSVILQAQALADTAVKMLKGCSAAAAAAAAST
jgi:hypothetical protein